jgi:hypothetical protein
MSTGNFRESDITKERIAKILTAGANVVLVSGGIDDLCLKYFVEAGAMAIRRCKKQDLKRIARATGGKMVNSLYWFWSFFCWHQWEMGRASFKNMSVEGP